MTDFQAPQPAAADGGPAFPVAYSNEADGPTVMPTFGMSLRDYIAIHEPIDPLESIGQLLAERLIGRAHPTPKGQFQSADVLEVAMFWADAEAAYRYMRADAMLKARGGAA